ncbi:MAG: AEC family transporter, partial [Methanobrevibacter sp.]|nr:AEC family transporter [Methanobrevibacter sp.]
MAEVLTTIIVILIIIFLGYFLKRINLLNISDMDVLNKLVINVALPCLVFYSLYSADLSKITSFAVMPLISIIVGTISGLIVFTILSLKKYSKKEKWSVIVPVVIGNTGFLGFPIVLGVFGQTALIKAIFYDIGTLIMFLSLSIILMVNFGGTIKVIVKRILGFPPLWATILGISFNFLNIPMGAVFEEVVGYLATATIPLIMISLGVSLRFDGIKNNLKVLGLGTVVKLLIAPTIAFILVNLLGLSGME